VTSLARRAAGTPRLSYITYLLAVAINYSRTTPRVDMSYRPAAGSQPRGTGRGG